METRILYIDDDLALAERVRQKLGELHHDVSHASHLEEAMAQLAAATFDVIVLDHDLSGLIGHEIIDRFRDAEVHVPVVYVIANDQPGLVMQALRNGAADYVIKDIGEDYFPLLADAVVQTAKRARMQREKDEADEELLRSKNRAEAMLSEMNHRIANSLALVSGLLRLQSGNTQNEETRTALRETQSRIAAIGGMHRRLYSHDSIGWVDMKPYIQALTEDIGATVGHDEEAPAIRVDVDPIDLPADKAVSVGMIVTELVTNALKYAYPQGPKGVIRVVFRREQGDEMARLAVEDDGVGLGGAEGSSTGLGRRIVNAMAASLGGAVVYPQTAIGTTAEVMVSVVDEENSAGEAM